VSDEAYGTLDVTQPNGISLTGVPSDESYGDLVLRLMVALSGVPSDEAYGTLDVAATQVVLLSGVLSDEAYGSHSVNTGLAIAIPATPSDEAHGTLLLRQNILLLAVDSAEVYGLLVVFRDGAILPDILLVDLLDPAITSCLDETVQVQLEDGPVQVTVT
jgi:hypothetical protein